MCLRVESQNSILYLPCKNCGSLFYQDSNDEIIEELPDGRMSYQPNSCDYCDTDLVSNEKLKANVH